MESTGSFLTPFHDADIAPGLVVGKGHVRVYQKPQRTPVFSANAIHLILRTNLCGILNFN
jgi:hypothetical protein